VPACHELDLPLPRTPQPLTLVCRPWVRPVNHLHRLAEPLTTNQHHLRGTNCDMRTHFPETEGRTTSALVRRRPRRTSSAFHRAVSAFIACLERRPRETSSRSFGDRELASFTLSPSLHVQAPSMVPTHASFRLMLTAYPTPPERNGEPCAKMNPTDVCQQ